MAARGYADAADVALALGVAALTAEQSAQVSAWLEATEQFIDRYTGHAWLTGALTDERYEWTGPRVPLRSAPVASVQSVKGQRAWQTATVTLTTPDEYQVADATTGLLLVRPWLTSLYDALLVSYTPVATAPALLTQVTAQLLADAIAGSSNQAGAGIQSFSVFGQVSMTFREASLSPAVRDGLNMLRGGPVLA